MTSLPSVFWLALAVAIVASVFVVRWVRDVNRRSAQRMLDEWTNVLPGKCPLCSWGRQREMAGYRVTLGEHYCPEGNSVVVPKASVRRM